MKRGSCRVACNGNISDYSSRISISLGLSADKKEDGREVNYKAILLYFRLQKLCPPYEMVIPLLRTLKYAITE